MNLSIGNATVAASAPVQHSRKTIEEATEFESILIGQCLEKLQQSFVGVGEDAEADPGQSTLSGLGTTALAQGLSQRGGLGIAQMLLRHLPPDIDQSVTNVIPAGLNLKGRVPITSVGVENGKTGLK